MDQKTRIVSIQKDRICPICGATSGFKETGWFYICKCGYWEADIKRLNREYSPWGK